MELGRLVCALNSYVFQVHPARGGNTFCMAYSELQYFVKPFSPFPLVYFDPFIHNVFWVQNIGHFLRVSIPTQCLETWNFVWGRVRRVRRFGPTKRRDEKQSMTKTGSMARYLQLLPVSQNTGIKSRNLVHSIANFKVAVQIQNGTNRKAICC